MRKTSTMLRRRGALAHVAVLPLLAAGCATMSGDPVQVHLVGLDPIDSEGMEVRFRCDLRVQNPNDAPIEFTGVYIELQVNGTTVATGVADLAGTVPRFGEALLGVPVTLSMLRVARVAIGIFTASEQAPIPFVLKGKIAGPTFSAVRFEARGEIDLQRFGMSRPPRS